MKTLVGIFTIIGCLSAIGLTLNVCFGDTFKSVTEKPKTFAIPTEGFIIFQNPQGEQVLRIAHDGTITLSKAPDEAAREFWRVVQQFKPANWPCTHEATK